MGRTLRVAFGRLAHETNALSRLNTTRADFERTHFYEGPELLRRCEWWQTEAPGMTRNAELSGFVRGIRETGGEIELVPLFSAWTVPGGNLSRETYESFKDQLLAGLAGGGPLDALFLSLHGALGVDGMADPEGSLLRDVRQAVGPGVKIAVSFDLHGFMTNDKIRSLDVMTSYRTNPHRDHADTGRRAGRLLGRTLRGEVRPTTAWRAVPMLIGGVPTLDFLAPMRPIYQRMAELERQGVTLSSSIFNGHLWHDTPHLGWASVVTTNGDISLAEKLADELADRLWSVRHHLLPEMPGPEEAIARARAAKWKRKVGTVVMSDASDMVGCGAVGENTSLLSALLSGAKDMLSYVPLRDDGAVAALWDKSPGERVKIAVGGTHAPEFYDRLEVSGAVRQKATVQGFGRMVVLDLGHVQLVLTEAPPLAMKPQFFSDVGLNPWKADICVVKSLFPFRFYFLPYNRLTLYVKTRGQTDFDVYDRMQYNVAMHPKEAVGDWRGADRARRLGA